MKLSTKDKFVRLAHVLEAMSPDSVALLFTTTRWRACPKIHCIFVSRNTDNVKNDAWFCVLIFDLGYFLIHVFILLVY